MKTIFLIFALCLVSQLQTVNPSVYKSKRKEISFEVESYDTSIVLEQVKIPESMKVYFLLSNIASDVNWEVLTEKSLSPRGSEKGVVLDGGEKDHIISFEKLQSHTSYCLYYFSEDKETQEKSEVTVHEIETTKFISDKKINVQNTESFNYEILRTLAPVCIPGFVICLIYMFLQKMDQVPDECFSFNKNEDGSTHDIPKILNVKPGSYFELFESSGRQEERNDESQELEERRLCGICCQRPRELIFLNCGHVYCCYVCSLSLQVCPIDQKPISTSLKFSMAMNYQAECCSNDLATSLYSSTDGALRNYEKEILSKLQSSFIKKLMKCVICHQKNKDTFFLNCGHMICCHSCSKDLTICPFDYIPITQIYQAYFP